MKRLGFVIDGRLPHWQRPWHLLRGCPSHSAVGEMRFGWIADHMNRQPDRGFRYELYRPWQRYDAVVFLKSMNAQSQALARSLRARGTRILFDVNVDYFTPATGTFYYQGMAPTAGQTEDARRMADLADALIADSSHLATVCAQHHPRVRWISDNVDMSLVPRVENGAGWTPTGETKLTLLWSGEAVKLFELLSIESVLREFAGRVRLVLVTNSLAAMDRWFDPWKERFESLLRTIDHEIVPFTSIRALLDLYARGGVFISPRFLDNSYNHGHTEWKIALPMSCGRIALGSPLPSYRDVERRSHGAGLRVCADDPAWRVALDEILSGRINLASEAEAARQVVRDHYSTPVVAAAHGQFVAEVCGDVTC